MLAHVNKRPVEATIRRIDSFEVKGVFKGRWKLKKKLDRNN